VALLLRFQTYLGLTFLLTIILGPFLAKSVCYSLIQRGEHVLKSRQQYFIYLDHSGALQGERFSISIYLSDVEDVCIWQTKLVYDSCLLVVLEIEAGDFLSANTVAINSTRLFYKNEPIESYINTSLLDEYAIVVFATDVAPGVLFIGGCSLNLQTISGSGKVATVTFGVCKPVSYVEVSLEESLLLNKDLMETRGSITIVS